MSIDAKNDISVRIASIDDSSSIGYDKKLSASNWRPGYRARFPVLAFLGIVGILACLVVIAAVLITSNHVSSSTWPHAIAPHTIINTVHSLSGLCLALVIAEGVSIAWWRKALKGASVEELHRSWTFSISLTRIARSFRAFDVIALAALAAKLAILDSFLLQDAASTYIAQDPAKNVSLVGVAAQTFPQTGYVLESNEGFGAQVSCACFMIGDIYTEAVDAWETSHGFFVDLNDHFQDCSGICYSYVDAIGFEIDCQKSTNHSDYAIGAISAYRASSGEGDAAAWTDLPIFNSSFSMSYADVNTNFTRLNMDLLYFDSDNPNDPSSEACPGTLTSVQCSLRPALVRYPITVVNFTNEHITNGISVGGRNEHGSNTNALPVPAYSYSAKQAEGFEILSYLSTDDQNLVNSITQLGGIANALSQYLSSTASITYTGSSLWGLRQTGILAQTMMFGGPNMGSCDCSFKDALSTLVNGINQLAFLTATYQTRLSPGIAAVGSQATVVGIESNSTAIFSSLPAVQINDVIHYKTLYKYFAAGIASTLLGVFLVLPTFWRYGEVGRPVTLGPMEIASAFGAPMLEVRHGAGEAPAKDLDELIAKVGHRKVVYGVAEDTLVPSGKAPGNPTISDPNSSIASPDTTGVEAHNNSIRGQSVRLIMGEPDRIRPVSGLYHSRPASAFFGSPPTSPRGPQSPVLPHN